MSWSYADWTAFKDTIVWMRDILTGLAAAGAVGFGFSGYRVWRKQLKGRNEYDVCMNLLVTLRHLLKSVGYLRNPLFTDAELSSAKRTIYDDLPFYSRLNTEQLTRHLQSVALYERNNELREMGDKLDNVHTEYQVLIGTDIDEPIDRIRGEVWMILRVTKEYADRIRPTHHSTDLTSARPDQLAREAVYLFENGAKDEVSVLLLQAEKEISKSLRKYIHP